MVNVALLKTETYEPATLDKAFDKAAEFAGFPDIRGATVLAKPNILKAAAPEAAVTTHPEFVAAAVRFLRRRGAARVLVGDSPAFQPGKACAKASGILGALEAEGAVWVDFVPGYQNRRSDKPNNFGISLARALEDCDLVLNLPKLKTHRLLTYTGAVKNLFGLVPGLGKSAVHLTNPSRSGFGNMIAEISAAVGRVYTFMDGIVAMEGEGPGNGEPRSCSLLLASENPAALDWVAAACIGYEPRKIPYLVRSLKIHGLDEVSPEITTGPQSILDVSIKGFKLLPYASHREMRKSGIPGFFAPVLGNLSTDRPSFSDITCTGCSACVKICPSKALELTKTAAGRNQVLIDDSACITCFCCHEVCPSKAISVGKVPWRKKSLRKAG